ncbi:MAG: N-6 DNA methylase [Alistipes senegalensis]|nr:N-6 DNA methylase [Alistipes senegalensis]
MTEKEQKKSAKVFAERWNGKGYEKGESQKFWIDLLQNVLGVSDATEYIVFEEQVKLDHTSFIDGYIDATHVMIEQKSIDKDLRKAIKQSDGTYLSPFQQAKRYASELPYSKRPRWIVTCNFAEFLVYDMEKPNGEPEQIFLKDLSKDYYRLQFLVDTGNDSIKREIEISLKAGELVGKLYDLILKQYKNSNSPETLKSLNMLCVRLVFCLYAEDSGIFGQHKMFGKYLQRFQLIDVRKALIELFQVLDTPILDRDPYMNDDLSAFPYVNGGLFADENIEIPRFTEEIVDLLVNGASKSFNWADISPTIFGAVFESTLNPETRRSGGMHYTSIENIHKVIDPLFLDDLKNELNEIKSLKVEKNRNQKLNDYRKKLSELTFLDPACGSGNFLTETYISLRRLENEALRVIYGGQKQFNIDDDLIKVGIDQFYGIEINDFAVTVAKTALWIAESQMMRETEEIIEHDLDFLPLKSYANIVEGNSLRIDWADVVPKDKLSYIMGNPPFVGVNYMSDSQREDMDNIWKEVKRGKLDYVTCWYLKSADIMIDTSIKTALVSTNSVSQGEQATILWKKLSDKNIHIDFAHKTFIWDSEASLKAHVHCVIIGFSHGSTDRKKYIYSSGTVSEVKNINGYLLNAPDIIVEERSKPICDVPAIVRGSQATDNGFYLFTPEEKVDFIHKEPQSEKYFRRFMMGKEFINNIERWCLWIPDISPKELKSCPEILKRVQAVKDFRLASKNKQTQLSANIPWRFGQYRPPSKNFIAFAKVSSERRRYIPFGFLTDDIITGDKLFTIPDATLYMFGILTSNVHMAWVRTVCGRLKSDYSYSTTIVYNNFPWCNPTPEWKKKIEHTAQAILNARNLYPDCSLADLYDELTMPPELRKAHQRNDFAVMSAYGFDKKITESECVAELMKLYQKLTKELKL